MSKIFYQISLITSISLLSFFPIVSAVVIYPTTTPTGEVVGGTFNQYFSNFLGPAVSCLPGQVVSGFSITGVLQCTTSTGYWNSNNAGSSIYFTGAGNVGIGTSSPQAKVEIKGNGSYNDSTIATSLSGYSQKARILPGTFGEVAITSNWYSVGNPGSALNYLDDSSRSGWDVQFGSASDAFYIHRMPPTSGAFTTGHSTFLTINNSGSVGIGTTTPDANLTIRKDWNGQTSQYIWNANTGSGASSVSLVGEGHAGRYAYLGYFNNSYISRYVWDAPNTGVLSSQGAGGLNISTTIGPIRFFTPMNESMRIDMNGNVGIGIATPSAKLHISGIGGQQLLLQGSQPTGNNYIMFNNNGTNLGYIGYGSTGNNGLNFINYQNDKMSLGTNNREMLYILPSGNVGIGTTTPSAKLEVNGNTVISSSISTQGGKIKRDFVVGNYTGGGAGHEWDPMVAHIKTNIRHQSGVMYRILVEGYNYGNGQSINSDVVGYTWTTGLYQTGIRDYSGGGNISQYLSSDGYLVIKITFGSAYYVGFSASAWFTNPTGPFDISGQIYWQMSNL